LIPAFNEQGTIGRVVSQASKFGDVFVADDGSTDETAKISTANGARVISQGVNVGYNSNLSFGLQILLRDGYDGVVTLDADGQHDPNQVGIFIDGLLNGFDLVVGTRPEKARVMEKIFGLVTSFFWKVSDPLCGMKAYSAGLLRDKARLVTYDSVGTEILMFAMAKKRKILVVSISGLERDGASRFAGTIRANELLAISLIVGMFRALVWSTTRRQLRE